MTCFSIFFLNEKKLCGTFNASVWPTPTTVFRNNNLSYVLEFASNIILVVNVLCFLELSFMDSRKKDIL